jgi:FtsZ-binding cell division protein ZapB
MSEETFTIESLIESNNILQGEISRLRESNRILRTVHRALRASNESLRRQVELAKGNDDLFKQFCAGAFDAPNATGRAVGLERLQSVRGYAG